MVAIDFGITIRPTPHGGTLPEMMRANDRILQAATEHDLTCWVIDHFQFDADPIFECLAFLAYHAGHHPGLRWAHWSSARDIGILPSRRKSPPRCNS